ASSFASKLASGIDIVTYPQHYDMHKQFLEPIEVYQSAPFDIDSKFALMPELFVVSEEAKKYFEETGEAVKLKVCVTGPIDLYTRTDFGYHVYPEVLMKLAESVNKFLRNSILKERFISTEVVSIDEPSLGYADFLNVGKEDLIEALDESLKGIDATIQVHLHGLSASDIPLSSKRIDVLTVEAAASPEQLKLISKKDLDDHDKSLRVGITRTNIDSIIPEWLEKGVHPTDEQLVDTPSVIKERYEKAEEMFGDRLAFVGPDCGLGSWPTQDVAKLLLKRTYDAVKT
ncbi:MAG: hypothetical protein V3W19_15810, partial [Desulfatiglandales bacterium]